MRSITKSQLENRTSKEELKSMLPCWMTYGPDTVCLMCAPEDIIYIGDLHPRVRNQFKAKEELVRRGMSKQSTLDTLVAEKKAVEKARKTLE